MNRRKPMERKGMRRKSERIPQPRFLTPHPRCTLDIESYFYGDSPVSQSAISDSLVAEFFITSRTIADPGLWDNGRGLRHVKNSSGRFTRSLAIIGLYSPGCAFLPDIIYRIVSCPSLNCSRLTIIDWTAQVHVNLSVLEWADDLNNCVAQESGDAGNGDKSLGSERREMAV
ncbi:hypothetical protein J6590_068873 [Homalodisca vitripennis]|nr:hypothetical protein J6590_068873 [Homalodisca vitripennis]